jgi:hypothetical protein
VPGTIELHPTRGGEQTIVWRRAIVDTATILRCGSMVPGTAFRVARHQKSGEHDWGLTPNGV